MTTLNHLPPSILLSILDRLDRESQLSAILASREVYLAAKIDREAQRIPWRSDARKLFDCPGWDVRVLPNPFSSSEDPPDESDTLAVEYSKKWLNVPISVAKWRETCANAILLLPHLRHFSATLPHILNPNPAMLGPEYTTLDTAGFLWHRLATHGRELKVTLMTHVEYTPTNIPKFDPTCPAQQTLTLIARPSSELNTPRLLCPELEAAESALRAGDLSSVWPASPVPLTYTSARAHIDNISSLAHLGYIPQKRKPRPMPQWLTPEQRQDLRDGPPSWGRKAKRAFIGFLGTFEPPGTDRLGPGRDSRDFEGGARPGWDGRSMARRLVQGR